MLGLIEKPQVDEVETLEFESPLLTEYIAVFLGNAKIAEEQDDSRVLLYRGQSDKSFSLTPSVFRKGLLAKEHLLVQELLLNAPNEFSDGASDIECLIKMQHYGLPTRLLDVTTNPLVALYFACNANETTDGEIIVFYDYMKPPKSLEAKCLIALSEYNGSTERQMLGFLSERGFKNIELGSLVTTTHIPIEAPKNNERIRRQHGAFLLVGFQGGRNDNPYQKTNFDLKSLLVGDFRDGILRSIVIPKEHKLLLLKELNALGINHAFLFPELEHQAAHIRSKYIEN
jgi:hypothetical protein